LQIYFFWYLPLAANQDLHMIVTLNIGSKYKRFSTICKVGPLLGNEFMVWEIHSSGRGRGSVNDLSFVFGITYLFVKSNLIYLKLKQLLK